jgi:hypothetical protein
MLLSIQLGNNHRISFHAYASNHRLSINRPTKRGKEKSPSDGHCQCEKEMDDRWTCVSIISERELYADPPF